MNAIAYRHIDTPIGRLLLVGNEDGLHAIRFPTISLINSSERVFWASASIKSGRLFAATAQNLKRLAKHAWKPPSPVPKAA